MSTRSAWLVAVFLGIAAVPCIARSPRGGGPPNILLAITDDQSWFSAGCYGDSGIKTPATDRIAREGVRFTNAYAVSPSCTPSRTGVLSGLPQYRQGSGGVLWGTLPRDMVTFTQVLRQHGYFVGSTGKTWGPGALEDPAQPAVGKSYFVREPRRVVGLFNDDYAASFAEFLKDRPAGTPFFFWYGSHEPHRDYMAGRGLKVGHTLADAKLPGCLPDVPVVRSDVLDYDAEVEYADQHLQRMLAMLEKSGELANTLVIVTSDNGMPFPRCKSTLYDGGTHEPLVISWPGHVPAGRVVTDFASLADLGPTILDAAGLPIPSSMIGRSLLPVLQSTKSGRVDPQRDFVVTSLERHALCRPGNVGYPCRAIRTDDYLYIRNFEPDRWPAGDEHVPDGQSGPFGDIDYGPTKVYMRTHRNDPAVKPLFELAVGKRPAEELYDLSKDPDELHNVAADPAYAAARAKMSARLMKYLTDTGDPRLRGEDPWDHYVNHGGARHPHNLPRKPR